MRNFKNKKEKEDRNKEEEKKMQKEIVKGFIGGFEYGKIEYDDYQKYHISENFLKDRYVAKHGPESSLLAIEG